MLLNFKKLIRSFKFGIQGIKVIAREEQTFFIQFLIAIAVIIAMFYWELSITRKAILLIVIILVLTLELINSVMERVLDTIHPKFNPEIKKIKDMLAGILLIACFGAIIIGILMFLPYL